MKLYYSPGACSLAPHIVLHEAGIPAETEKVDLASKKTAGGADYLAVNAKGYVPALVLDQGGVLTEAAAILQYLADQRPEKQLAPAFGSGLARYRLIEWLNFITAEIHKSYSPLFKPDTHASTREAVTQLLNKRYDYVEQALGQGGPFLLGETFTVADAYLFTITNWAAFLKIDMLSTRPQLGAYMKRIFERPAVQQAMKDEGLLR